MKVRYAETALRELDEIFAYISERNPPAAAAVLARIEGLAELLGQLPLVGHPTNREGVLVMPLVRYPYLIFYTVDDHAKEVLIVHVRHGARLRP